MKQLFFELLFWISGVLIVYTYAGYPALLSALSRLFPRRSRIGSGYLPRVSLIVSAYNERGVIAAKLDNALAADYPRDRFEVVVVSDCSNDGTDEIVATYASRGVRLVRQPNRLGKSSGLNLAVPEASGDVVVFSDANAMYKSDAIRELVQHLSDPGVGYVVGDARYVETSDQAASADSEGLYWKLESWLKRKESEFGSVVGGDGAIYAIRRELFTPLRPTDINDFLNPLQIIVRGYRGVYEPRAICWEQAGDSFKKEFNRKVRIVSRSLNAVRREPAALFPWTQPRHWFALASHKVLRWFAPVVLILLFLSSVEMRHSTFYQGMLWLQCLFYSLAAVGWAVSKYQRPPAILYLPYYFCLVNQAALLGIVKCFGGRLSPTWQTVRQEQPT